MRKLKHWAKLCWLILPLTLAGCSSKFAYNNLDWLLYWYLDDYVELDKQQKRDFDLRLDEWLAWHRSEELVKYRQQLIDLKSAIGAGQITPEQWLTLFADVRQHWVNLRERITPELMPFAQSLTDEQVDSLFAEMAKQDNKRIEKWQKKTAQERAEEDLEDRLDQLKDWWGKLSDEQIALVTETESQFTSTFMPWMEYRQAIQTAARDLFEQRQSNPDFQAQLLYLLNHPEEFQSESLTQAIEDNRNLYATMASDLSASLSDKQRKHFLDEIDDLIDDLTDLIED